MTVVGAAVLGLAVVLGMLLTVLAGALADRAVARAGADLAALAGAYAARAALAGGGESPCAAAERAAVANATTLVACQAFGDGSVQVTVASGGHSARARAGPG
jgi:hypothetical protein